MADYDQHQLGIIERYRGELLSGTSFRYHSESNGSVRGYKPVLDRGAYVHAVRALAELASQGNSYAQVANTCLHRINLYGTRPEEAAHIYDAAAQCFARGYDNVILRSSPEPGRPSGWQRPFTLLEAIVVALWLQEATSQMTGDSSHIGWCLQALMDEADVQHYPSLIPAFARAKADA
jgi:hypothetical protein